MRILAYSGESVVTTDGVGAVIVEYARALIADNSTDVVDIPVLFDGQELTASLVLGPASQLLVLPSHAHNVRLEDEMTIARLRTRTAALAYHPVLPVDSASLTHDELSYDF